MTSGSELSFWSERGGLWVDCVLCVVKGFVQLNLCLKGSKPPVSVDLEVKISVRNRIPFLKVSDADL